MSFSGSPAMKGLQSPLNMHKGSPSPRFKSPRNRKKKSQEEDFNNGLNSPSAAIAGENRDPNFSVKVSNGPVKSSGGSLKSNILEVPSLAVASGTHSCKSRRCAANYSDWGSVNFKAQPRKFLVAKRHDRPEKEPAECKCSEKKADGDKSRKCACVASKELRASQEEFCKENLQLTPSDSAEEEEDTGRGKDCKTQVSNVNFEIPNDDKRHEFECNVDGRYGFAEKNGDIMCNEDNRNEKIQCAEEGINGFWKHERKQCGEQSINGFYREEKHEEVHCGEEGRNGFCSEGKREEPQLGEVGTDSTQIDEDCERDGYFGLRDGTMHEKLHCYQDGIKDFDGCVKVSSTPQNISSAPRRMRNELLEEAISTIPQQGGGRVKHLVKAFESLMCIPDSETVVTEGYRTRPSDRSLYNFPDCTEEKRELSVSRVVKWALPGMQGQASAEKLDNNSPSNESFGDVKRSNSDSCLESYADFKFRVSEDTPSVVNSDTQSVCSGGRSGSSSGSRRRGTKGSLDSSGQGSLGRSGMQQWKKQLKVTAAQPFKLQTEQRGLMKEREFMKKLREMLTEEEKLRIPIAQGLPWTTDEPECLIKPPVKENTKPLDVKLHTEIRAVDRAEFDHIISERLRAIEQERLEQERLQKLAEEEEIKRLRKELVPRAQPMPFFDRPFIPKRSSKLPTIPKEPRFHIPNHKRAKSISWNDFNAYQ